MAPTADSIPLIFVLSLPLCDGDDFRQEGGVTVHIRPMAAGSNPAGRAGNELQQAADDVLGKDDFLKLLLTQLKYQDPLNPIDDKEFIAQMAQFSSLEQMQNLNTTMSDFAEAQQKLTALGQAMAMMGRTVELLTREGETFYGEVNGVQFSDAWPKVLVDGKLYGFDEVVAILEGGTGDG